jgi:acetyl-CoA carboxylase carboxyl transferase subunit alpha
MKITAQDLLRLGIIDGIIPEPVGGAHRDGSEVIRTTGATILSAIAEFDDMPPEEIRQRRREKFLAMGRAG